MRGSQNAKGSAEGATSVPSRSPNSLEKENAVDTITDTTTPGASATISFRWENDHPAEAKRIRSMETGELVVVAAAFRGSSDALLAVINQPRCDDAGSAHHWIDREMERLGAVREMIMEELRGRPSKGDYASEDAIRAVFAYDVHECGEGFLHALGTMAHKAAAHEFIRNEIKHGRAAA